MGESCKGKLVSLETWKTIVIQFHFRYKRRERLSMKDFYSTNLMIFKMKIINIIFSNTHFLIRWKKYIKCKLSPWLKIDIFIARISNWKTLYPLSLFDYKLFDDAHCWSDDSFLTCALFCFRHMCECFDAFLCFCVVWTETSLFFIHFYKSTQLFLLYHLYTCTLSCNFFY
jgi:hypothetical protein